MAKKRIIIAEDELLSAYVLRNKLCSWGYEVLSIITGGHELVENSISKRPDLLLMDIYLDDDINGVEAVQTIQREYRVPVIYITASSDPSTIEKAKKTYHHGIIFKPYTIDEVKASIEQLFSLSS